MPEILAATFLSIFAGIGVVWTALCVFGALDRFIHNHVLR
jgi:hypothetical protein